jgi:hypothetical protein
MFSAKNLTVIKNNQMGYIISPRIKSLKADIKQELKSHDFNKEPFFKIALEGSRLIVTYLKKS